MGQSERSVRLATVAGALAAVLLLGATPPVPPSIGEALAATRLELDLHDGRLDGEAAPVLREALAQARYVAVGEDHFTNEVPAFVSALCDTMAPQGLDALALEIGPAAAAAVAPLLLRPDRLARMAQLTTRYPNAVAFLDGRADNDMAAHCRVAVPNRTLPVLGLDQEYIGSAGLVLDRILAEQLSPAAWRAVTALREEERAKANAAARTGNAAALLLTSVAPARLEAVRATLLKGGSLRALTLFDGLRESAAIYALNARGDPAANTRRATLLKRQFAAQAPATGRVLLKFGDWHLYRGANPLGNFDLGNYLTERADSRGERSLHILVLGARGVHAKFAGYARAPGRSPFVMTDDPDYAWLRPAVEQQLATGWTMFDLRRLRHRRLAGLDADWMRVIAGYDLLVLIPQLTPTEPIAR